MKKIKKKTFMKSFSNEYKKELRRQMILQNQTHLNVKKIIHSTK